VQDLSRPVMDEPSSGQRGAELHRPRPQAAARGSPELQAAAGEPGSEQWGTDLQAAGEVQDQGDDLLRC
jgi:hypothetical protein